MFDALKDEQGPQGHLHHLGRRAIRSARSATQPERFGIEIATGGNILAALKAYKELPGMEGATYYYYEIPKNPVNDWLVAEHQKRFNAPPDFFTAGGMAAGIAVVEALKKAGSHRHREADRRDGGHVASRRPRAR